MEEPRDPGAMSRTRRAPALSKIQGSWLGEHLPSLSRQTACGGRARDHSADSEPTETEHGRWR